MKIQERLDGILRNWINGNRKDAIATTQALPALACLALGAMLEEKTRTIGGNFTVNDWESFKRMLADANAELDGAQ